MKGFYFFLLVENSEIHNRILVFIFMFAYLKKRKREPFQFSLPCLARISRLDLHVHAHSGCRRRKQSILCNTATPDPCKTKQKASIHPWQIWQACTEQSSKKERRVQSKALLSFPEREGTEGVGQSEGHHICMPFSSFSFSLHRGAHPSPLT